MKIILSSLFLISLFVSPLLALTTYAQSENKPIITENPIVYMFGRDDCVFCISQIEWMDEKGIDYIYLNITEDDVARDLYNKFTNKHELAKITPITVVGNQVFSGFNSPRTTGVQILSAIADARYSTNIKLIEKHDETFSIQYNESTGGVCTDISCEPAETGGFIFDLPLVGIVDLKTLSLFSLSLILGVIDGFNPCAMWVLITFLIILSQVGNKKKMILLAGLFIVAQGIMYNLILNVWYKTWDFIALDQYVTPMVGFLALAGGVFFLWRWNKNKNKDLVCDITNSATQSRTINKLKDIVSKPITIVSILAILLIAFSINVIEFACSIGIPQAYTKILEMNMLSFLERQWYILVFTIGYMVDDVIVFALAIWGYSKLQASGAKYAQWSLLIGGLLMLVLGIILVANPSLLVF